jgi:hypothetical protein
MLRARQHLSFGKVSVFAVTAAAIALSLLAPAPVFAQRSFAAEQSALGFTGQVTNDVLKVNFLRQDTVIVNGQTVPPALVLEGFISLQFGGTSSSGATQTLAFGEFPLREEDVEAFKTALVQAGVDISSLHNHEIQEQPRWLFMHIEAFGDSVAIAKAIRTALDSTHATYKDITTEDANLPGKSQVQSIMPSDAKVQGREGVIDVELDRREQYSSCETVISSFTSGTPKPGFGGDINASALAGCRGGTNQINVIPEAVVFSDITVDWKGGQGTVDADLSLLVNEVNPVLRFLESKGFKLSALHNHTLATRPEVLFLHASADGDVVSALQAIRTAWDATGGRTLTPAGTSTSADPTKAAPTRTAP